MLNWHLNLSQRVAVRNLRRVASEVSVMWVEKISQQLGRPTRSVAGWLVSKFLKVNNQIVEERAVSHCGIQPGDTVLELGHGPGLGLQFAAKMLPGPRGHLLGVDYSEYMHQMASRSLKDLVVSGKLTLHHCDVAAMPLGDNSVDKVFHCNCYYFWPDLRKAGAEIHQVMKPGGLMVTTLILSRITAAGKKNLFSGENWHPDAYMAALRDSGFIDVRMEEKWEKDVTYQVIFATAPKGN